MKKKQILPLENTTMSKKKTNPNNESRHMCFGSPLSTRIFLCRWKLAAQAKEAIEHFTLSNYANF